MKSNETICKDVVDKTGKFITRTCKRTEGKIIRICKHTKKLKPPVKIGWYKDFLLCKDTIAKPQYKSTGLKCKDTIDKKGKFITSGCQQKMDNVIKICKTITKKPSTTSSPKLGSYTVTARCTKKRIKQSKRKQSKRKQSKSKQSKSKTNKRKTLRGGTVNPFAEIGSMFGTLGSSLQSVVNSLSVPVTPAFNQSLPISADPSKQFTNNEITQPISTIYKSL
jgi:hypothetical protein